MRVSEYYELDRTQSSLDFVDIRLDTDIPVFLDPVTIKANESIWVHDLIALLQNYFGCVLAHIKSGDHQKARSLLASLNERNEFHLGYSKGRSRGHAFGSISAKSVWKALSNSQASMTGLLQDLEDASLLIDGVGTDMISDAVCNIIRGPLIRYTQDMCQYYDIPLETQIDSGPMWNLQTNTWEHSYVSLPIAGDYGKFILVPKVLVRHRLSFKYDEYYRHFLLPEMQDEEIKAKSALVWVLKDGRKRVTKKSLMEKYGADKLAVVTETLKRPQILEQYKLKKQARAPLPLTHEELADIELTPHPDWEKLAEDLESISAGRLGASKYEDTIEKILSSIFYPSLGYPIKQHEIHQGRKRIDITYTNQARNGFFRWISMHYPASHIFIECKNYGKDVGNPELDQLAGRFSPSRGQVGILVHREIADQSKLDARCKDTAHDQRGFIITLDDNEVKALIAYRIENYDSNEFPLLKQKFERLIH